MLDGVLADIVTARSWYAGCWNGVGMGDGHDSIIAAVGMLGAAPCTF